MALRPRGLALRQQAVQRFTVSTTRIPGAAATPERGSCATTRPPAPPADTGAQLQLRERRAGLRARASRRAAARRRRPRARRRASPCRTPRASRSPASARRRRPAACPASPALYDDGRLERLADQPRLGRIERLAADVRAPRPRSACSSRPSVGASPVKNSIVAAPRQLPLSSSSLPSRKITLAGDAYGTTRDGNVVFGQLQVRQRLRHERLPDQRRKRAALDRVAVVLGQHRHQLVRVADPDRRHEVGREADEPGVAVVLGRAGLAGDLAAGKLRRRAGAVLTTPRSIWSSIAALPLTSQSSACGSG